MQTVSPIRNKAKIKAMANYLAGADTTGRNAVLFRFGISTALRISDILRLKHDDLFILDYRFREYLSVVESKTKKKKKGDTKIKLPEKLREEIKNYCKNNNIEKGDWIFPSHKNKKEHLDRTNCWRFLKEAAEAVGIEKVGCHTLRKTFGYHYYKQTKDIYTLMKMLNHSDQEVTMRYIGTREEEKGKVYQVMEDLYEI